MHTRLVTQLWQPHRLITFAGPKQQISTVRCARDRSFFTQSTPFNNAFNSKKKFSPRFAFLPVPKIREFIDRRHMEVWRYGDITWSTSAPAEPNVEIPEAEVINFYEEPAKAGTCLRYVF